MTLKVNPAVIRKRMDQLWELKKQCLVQSAKKALGGKFRVIVERCNETQQAGLTDEGLRVVFPKKEGWLGREAFVKVTGLQQDTALAEWA